MDIFCFCTIHLKLATCLQSMLYQQVSAFKRQLKSYLFSPPLSSSHSVTSPEISFMILVLYLNLCMYAWMHCNTCNTEIITVPCGLSLVSYIWYSKSFIWADHSSVPVTPEFQHKFDSNNNYSYSICLHSLWDTFLTQWRRQHFVEFTSMKILYCP